MLKIFNEYFGWFQLCRYFEDEGDKADKHYTKILNINDKVLPRILSKKDEIKVITVSITINECIRYHIKPVIQTCKLSGVWGILYTYTCHMTSVGNVSNVDGLSYCLVTFVSCS